MSFNVIVALVQAVMLPHDNANHVALPVFLNTLRHFLEGEQQERIMSYLPLSNIGMALDIQIFLRYIAFWSTMDPCGLSM